MGRKGQKSERQFSSRDTTRGIKLRSAGNLAKAGELMRHLRDAEPSLTVSGLGELNPFRRPDDFAKWADGLREAGLPK
jgi:hypothetical protein